MESPHPVLSPSPTSTTQQLAADSECKSENSKSRRPPRPARQIYVPKARRSGDGSEGGPLSKSSSYSDSGSGKRRPSSPSERSLTSESPTSAPSRSASSLAGRVDASPESLEFNPDQPFKGEKRDSPPSEDTNSLKDDSERSDPGSLELTEGDTAGDWEMVRGSKPRGLVDRQTDVKAKKKVVVGSKLRSDYVQPANRRSRADVETSTTSDDRDPSHPHKMTTSTPRSNRHEDNIQVGTDWSNFHHKREKKKEDWSSPKRDQNCCDEGRESRTDSHHERKDSATYVVNQHDDRGDNKSDHKQRQPSGFGRAKNVDKKVGANVAAVVRRGGANPYPQPQPNKLPSQVILEMLKKSGIDMPVEQFQRAAAESVKKTGEKDEESAKEKSVAKQKKVEVTRQQNNQAKDTSAQPETYKCAESLPFDSQPVRPSDSPTDVQAAVAQVINNNSLFFDPYQQYRVDCNNPTNASVLPASNVSFDIDSILRAIPSSYDDFEFFNEKLSAVKGPQYEPESQLLQIGSTQLNIESPQKGYDGLKWKSPFDSHLSVLKNDQTSDTKVTGSSPFGFSTDDISHKVGLSSHLDSFGILTPQPPAAESPGLSLLDPNDLEVQLINESRLKVENILGNSDMMKLFYSQPNPELPAATTLVNELQSQAAKLTTNLSATIEIIKPQKTVSTSAKHPKKKEESKLPSQWKISESWSLAKPKKLTEESENKTSDSHSVVSETHSDSRQSPQPSLPSFGAVPLAEVNVVADWLAQQDLAQKAPEPHTIQTLLKLPPTTISPEMIGGNDWRSGLAAYTAARFGGGETKSVAAGAETIMSDGSVSGRSSAHSAPGKDDLIVKAAQKITWAKWGAGGLGAPKLGTSAPTAATEPKSQSGEPAVTIGAASNILVEEKPLEVIQENSTTDVPPSTNTEQIAKVDPQPTPYEKTPIVISMTTTLTASTSFQPIVSPMTVAPRAISTTGTSSTSESDIEIARGGRASIVSGSCGSSFAGDNWEDICDERGEICNPKIIEELNAALGEVHIEKPSFDYYDFRPKDLEVDGDEFSHILEVFDFSSSVKTEDIHVALTQLGCVNFGLKWVDDSHALVILSSDIAAQAALRDTSVVFKLRPLSEATTASKQTARLHLDCLQPFKPRPETSALLARRMVEGHLGMKTRISPEQRTHERKKLQAAKERKKELQKAKVDVWEGNA